MGNLAFAHNSHGHGRRHGGGGGGGGSVLLACERGEGEGSEMGCSCALSLLCRTSQLHGIHEGTRLDADGRARPGLTAGSSRVESSQASNTQTNKQASP
jgi:hypothetical protein